MAHGTTYRVKVYLFAAIALLAIRVSLGSIFASASDITPQSVAAGVNNERSQRNIATLNYNNDLAEAAQTKAADMIARNYFAHVDPDGNYIWPTIVADGYTPYTTLGENLAINFPDTESLMSAWIDSPTHRENILNAAFQDQGAGYSTGNVAAGQYSDAIANTFGALAVKPAPKAPAPTPAPVKAAAPAPAKSPVPAPTKPTPAPTPAPVKTPTPTPAPVTAPVETAPPASPNNTSQNSLGISTNEGLSTAAVNEQTISIVPSIVNGQLDLHATFEVTGNSSSVTASVLGTTVQFQNQGNGIYSGDVMLEQYDKYTSQDMTIAVTDTAKHESDTIVPLKNYPLPPSQNPASIANIAQQVKNPDLYTLYKYIIYAFAVLFFAMVIADSVLFKKTRKLAALLTDMSHWNVPMVLLAVGTFMTIWWWH